ncbi:polysaccharide biosynthesis tyrosine autokinase [Celeribacter indicus]|uniref:Acetyltransferase n=1 Tax=Celeribacter indicus TaxID=1208324 RepID=A0A0B5E6X3_9RHOB|nr:polysaccharide biosynthesis tyrosine autokinase [Celeribacter indicus]AJE48771.1 acetyltransferase [Celeribacter indicus]SDX10984.1 tyrosine-protein kinase Etk/Wzc [Celeribacter indicus]
MKPMTVETVHETQENEIDLLDLARRIWGSKLHVLAITCVVGLLGFIFAMGTPPTYRADALLQLEEKGGQLVLPTSLSELTGEEPRSAAEIEILRSRFVMGQAVASGHFDWVAEAKTPPVLLNVLFRLGIPVPDLGWFDSFARAGDRLTLEYLEVPPEWLSMPDERPVELVLGEADSFELILPNETRISGRVGEMVRDEAAGFAIRVGSVIGEPGREFTIRQLSEDGAIARLRGRFSVSERGRQTNILELGMVSRDRQDAERELRAITDAYLSQNIARSAAEADSSLSFVESQLPAAEAEVRSAEAALNDYRSEQSAIDLSFEAQSALTQITTLEADLRRLDAREDEVSERYTPNHPVYQQLLAERQRLEDRLAELRNEVNVLPETQREVINLTRDLELAQEVYVQLLNRAQELRVLSASTIGNVRVVDQARTAVEPVAPARARILALSILLGMILGIAYVLIRAALRRGVHDAQEIEATGLPVFATINLMPDATNHRKIKGDLPLHALTHPNDLAIEGFRSLRTSLHFGMLDADTHTVAITSAAPGMGKSFVSTNLGVVAAQAGQRVCLVDADLRMGYLRRYFRIPKVHLGLSDVLCGKATLEDVLVEGPLPDLYLLPSGAFPPNPSELLMRDRFREVLAELDDRFDLTLVDTPPVLAVTDPLIISRAVGATLLVTRFDETPVREIEAVQKQYLNAGLRLNGAVLNAYDPKRATSSAYGYSYSYRYAYGQGKKK